MLLRVRTAGDVGTSLLVFRGSRISYREVLFDLAVHVETLDLRFLR